MVPLPVITGFGGFNSAGRSSFHQAYQRTIFDSLNPQSKAELMMGLGTMMGELRYDGGFYRNKMGSPVDAKSIGQTLREHILSNTLVRRIPKSHFDVERVRQNKLATLMPTEHTQFVIDSRKLPEPLPSHWHCEPIDSDQVRVTIDQASEVLLPSYYTMSVQSAGLLPTGFDPASYYPSRFHPRGLQMALLGASDAVSMMGIDWDDIQKRLPADAIGVYASSIMSQLDEHSLAGLLQARLQGKRVSTKQLALGLNTMPADFVNAYVLGNLGVTGSMTGACASFLYNLRLAVEDIVHQRRQVVVVGCSEAPVTPEIIDGYATMGALASDDKLARLDGLTRAVHAKASRPFGENCGFTIAESSQYVVLMSDELALELGATIYGSVPGVFVHADGPKKSISAPGPGNYITFAKAVACAQAVAGEQVVREQSFIQAHGSSTPQNRVTESAIFDKVARAFNINEWPVAAVKAFVGHSLGPASGDQLASSLGVFEHHWLPGIPTIDKVADDVYNERLLISTKSVELNRPSVSFLNSKGFGGNNATACVLSPNLTKKMLEKRFGSKKMFQYKTTNELTVENASEYDKAVKKGNLKVRYRFGENLISEQDIEIDQNKITIAGWAEPILLSEESLYEDMK